MLLHIAHCDPWVASCQDVSLKQANSLIVTNNAMVMLMITPARGPVAADAVRWLTPTLGPPALKTGR